MGLYGFKPRFVPHILDGSKQHTIRGYRAHPDRPGNRCHLYTGLRQKGATLLGRPPCVKVERIYITSDMIEIEEDRLDKEECNLLAWRDGFRFDNPAGRLELTGSGGCFELMLDFWKGRLPFEGQIIHWDWSRRLT